MPDNIASAVAWSPKPASDVRWWLSFRRQGRGDTRTCPEPTDVVARTIGIGAVSAVSGHERVHQTRVRLEQLIRAETQPLERVDAQVGQEDVGLGDHAVQRVASTLFLEIEHHAALAAIVEIERWGLRLAVPHDHLEHAPHRVPLGRLDLDDLGSPVRQDARCRGAGNPHPEFDDPVVLEHAVRLERLTGDGGPSRGQG